MLFEKTMHFPLFSQKCTLEQEFSPYWKKKLFAFASQYGRRGINCKPGICFVVL